MKACNPHTSPLCAWRHHRLVDWTYFWHIRNFGVACGQTSGSPIRKRHIVPTTLACFTALPSKGGVQKWSTFAIYVDFKDKSFNTIDKRWTSQYHSPASAKTANNENLNHAVNSCLLYYCTCFVSIDDKFNIIILHWTASVCHNIECRLLHCSIHSHFVSLLIIYTWAPAVASPGKWRHHQSEKICTTADCHMLPLSNILECHSSKPHSNKLSHLNLKPPLQY